MKEASVAHHGERKRNTIAKLEKHADTKERIQKRLRTPYTHTQAHRCTRMQRTSPADVHRRPLGFSRSDIMLKWKQAHVIYI